MNASRLVFGVAVSAIWMQFAIVSPCSAQADPLSRSLSPKKFAAAIQQRKDPALRKDALAVLEENLQENSNDTDIIWALAALQYSLTAKFDHASVLDLVAPRLKSDSPEIRVLALRCLPNLNYDIGDLDAIGVLAEDQNPRVRSGVGAALIRIANGDAPAEVIPVLTRLLRDEDPDVIERTLRSMWGQYSSQEFDALLIALSEEEKYHGHVIYHALSTMQSKSVAVCKRLIEELDNPDWNNSGRAAWGLTYGVVDDAYPAVEEALLRAIPEELNDYTRKQEYRALKIVATEKSQSLLNHVVASEMETDKDKVIAQEILDQLRRAKPPE